MRLRNRNEASVAEPAPGRRDEIEEFGRACCEPTEGAWVLVQVRQEATEGFMQGVVCLGLRFNPTPLWAAGRGGGEAGEDQKEPGRMGWAGLGCWRR